MYDELSAIAAGFFLDCCLGDPHRLPHPVRTLGKLIESLERRLRGRLPKDSRGELAAGAWMVVLVLGITAFVAGGLLWLAGQIHPLARWTLSALMVYYLLAAKSLREESLKVYSALEAGDLAKARGAVAMIVGRDVAALDGKGVARAAVETVAENTSDGVIAPLFYLMLGGPVLGFLYKAVNTMDSMVGYKNERYLYFGRAAARLDDLWNLIPARLSAWFMVAGSVFLGYSWKNAMGIYFRDRYRHKSPNSAHTEAVLAGALGIRLAGNAWYFGRLVEKPYIGDALREIAWEDIRRANRLMYAATAIGFVVMALVRWRLFR